MHVSRRACELYLVASLISCLPTFRPCPPLVNYKKRKVSILVTSRHVTSRHVTSRHVTSRHVTSRHLHVVAAAILLYADVTLGTVLGEGGLGANYFILKPIPETDLIGERDKHAKQGFMI